MGDISDVTCAEARGLLERVRAGGAVAASAAWSELERRGAVGGTPGTPQLTQIGEHVLRELSIRAARCDAWPLDQFADDLTRILGEIESLARNTEYFLTSLGPITPPEAVPYLRIVGVGLAKRREDPDELAERFRNVWGMVEVMGGDARDRLLGAEILTGTNAAMGQVYAPMMSTVEKLRAADAANAVATAAILELDPSTSGAPAVERWQEARRTMPSDEAAALLTTVLNHPAEREAFEKFKSRFAGSPEMSGRLSAALYLAAAGVDPSEGADRVLEVSSRVGARSPRPLLTAAILAMSHPIGAEELLDWVAKASEAAQRYQLAASSKEFFALGVALVEALPRSTFAGPGAGTRAELGRLGHAATLLALHAWIYRPILEPPRANRPPMGSAGAA